MYASSFRQLGMFLFYNIVATSHIFLVTSFFTYRIAEYVLAPQTIYRSTIYRTDTSSPYQPLRPQIVFHFGKKWYLPS